MDNQAVGVDHYENFPVASWLCPPRLRPAITAIYHFARTADDLADEGEATTTERLALLARYEAAMQECAAGRITIEWPHVFAPLALAIDRHRLPLPLLNDLLSAFRQDAANPLYADRAELLDYCRRSAHPIGRLLLHLVGLDDSLSLQQSDAICTALQLANFWQDLSIDLPRARCYLPRADAIRHGIALPPTASDNAATRALVRELVKWTRDLMRQGEPLVHRVPGRFGWELRLVVQGGIRVLDKIEACAFNVLTRRPRLDVTDVPRLVWRAYGMRRDNAATLIADEAVR
jgi:squalene synthase HpnC